MEEEIRQFTARLINSTLSDDNIIDEKLKRFQGIEDRRLKVLLNHQFFASSNRLTSYLLMALQEDPRQSQPIRKKIYQFISNHIRTQYLLLIDHAKNLFSQMISLFWKEEGRLKQSSIEPISAIIQAYDQDFLVNNDILKPQKLHEDVKIMLQTQKKSHGVIGQCWYLLAVIQSKFPHLISPTKKKTVQQMIFVQLKQYVNTDKNLNTIAALIRGLSKALKENYFGDVLVQELFTYVMVLIPPLKATYSVHLAALELLSQRRQLFHGNIMLQARKIFVILRQGVNHKNKDYKMKCLEVLIEITEELVKGISQNKSKYQPIFTYIQKQILQDLQSYVSKDKGEPASQQKKGLNLLTVVRLLGIISPLYLQFQGKKHYKQMFDYIIKKCTKKIMKENHLYTIPNSKSYDIKYVLYAQKELNSFILSLSRLVEHLDQIQYSAANQLEEIFISAVKESKYFLAKYEPDLWEALIQLVMSIHSKGTIFSKWSKKVISQSLKECLDSKKMGVENDDEFIKMIEKAGHFWKSILAHSSWRTGPLHEFTDYLLSNMQYLMLNLNCGYRIKGEGEEMEQMPNQSSQDEDIVQIFYLANEKIELVKIQDYQYLSSLSLLFHQILTCIDPSLYNQKITNFYPQILQRIKIYPKCLPLLRTLRALNQYILKNNVFKNYLSMQVEYSRELIEKMVKFFDYAYQIVFKFQEQYFYELLKVLLSFSELVYLHNTHRIMKHFLPNLLIKTFEMGQEIISLANAALKCMSRLFTLERETSERYLLPVISSLQKYINLTTDSEKQEFKSQLFLFELSITREELSSSILSFLGSLGGLCHQLVDSKNKDHISWDYDCHLEVQINILNEKLTLNLTRMLNRICWLSVSGKDEIKIVACELLHAKITYVIEQIVSNKMDKENLSVFLDRVLPTILTIASNTSHPSQQLIHTLLIQIIHFFANTKQPNSPDVQIILKHLLSLYNKSQDMGFIASKCLSEFIRWHIKQQSQKNGDVPILKALMSNIWSLVGNKNARQGIINFLVKLLKIIHRENEIMRYYSIELGSLLISLARYHHKLDPQFKYLLQKYAACIKKYMRYLIIPEEGRRYKKTPTIHAFLEDLYKAGFFSVYQQQRQASFLICFTILKQNTEQLGYTQLKFLRDRAHKQKKYLFGSSHQLDFKQIQETDFGKFCWRLVALGEIWIKIFDQKIFSQDNLVQFLDLQCVYLVSFVSLLQYLQNAQQNSINSWNQEIQESIVINFKTFLKIIKTFNLTNSSLILGKFLFNLDQNNFSQKTFHNYLFNIVFKPQAFIMNFNRDILTHSQLKLYLQYFIHYLQVRDLKDNKRVTSIDRVFTLLNSQIKFSIDKMVDYFCCDESASERTILSIIEFIKTAYKYELDNFNKTQNNYLKTLLSKLLNQYQKGKAEREYNIVKFILSFSYSITHQFVIFEIQTNSHIFQRYQKFFLDYIVKNWETIDRQMIKISLSSVNNIKVLYVLLIKLSLLQKERFLLPLSQQPITENLIRDLLKINFLLVKELDLQHREKEQNIERYIVYLQKLIDQGLLIENAFAIHQQTLYLCGIIIHKKLQLGSALIKTLKATLNTLGNKYCPYCISRLDNPQKQESAMKYFNTIRNLIVISQEFNFIDQFFIELKDTQLSQQRKETINNYIEDCVRTCFNLQNHRPLEWAEMILSFYWDEQLDKDEWLNYRLLILQFMFRKAVIYMKVEHLQILYDKYVSDLQKILKRPLSYDSLKSLLLDMQVKNGAFLIIELLYDNLPRRQKKEGMKSENQIHKLFIKYSIDVVKKILDQNFMRLIRQNDERVGQTKKAIKVYKQHNCYAYNTLIVLFISTQSNPEHFKTFLFEHNKQALWDNLVDTSQEDFNFQIETSFKVIQPFSPLRNKIKEIQTKIQKAYFESSLYVVQEQNIPLGNLQQIAQQNEQEQKQAVPIKNTHNIIMVNTLIEEDIINKHPCMMNLLRVVDYLTSTFPQNSTWMKPIETYLSNQSIKLAQAIFLIKLILNRPNIFYQAEVWAPHLLNYLSLKETGGKFIHYFYRDALKRFLKFLPQLVKVKPDVSKINFIIMKIIKSLPHQNVRVFSDNIDMLQQLLRVPGVYVQKKTINSMLNSQKEKNDWRMCAVITLKLCITARVPVIAEKDYARLKDTPAQFDYYYNQIKNYMKFVYELAAESSKKYRIAAAGFLGEFLGFLFTSGLEEHQKKEHFRSVSLFLISLLEKTANRSNKEKFTLALQKISIRFPQLLADQKLFAIVEDSMFQFNGTERYSLLLAFKEFTRSLLAFSQITKISNFFMLLRVNCERIVSDVNEVRMALLQILMLCTDHRLLKDKNILFTFHLIIEKLDALKEVNQQISQQYYELLIKLKKYLTNPQAKIFEFSPNLLVKVEEKLIEGLNSKYQNTYKMLFNEFEQEAAIMNQPDNIIRYMKIFNKLYNKKSEGEWLINVVPIILTLCRISSDYGRLFSQTKLEENMFYYDWDFRNFKINDASLPYTPFTVYAGQKKDVSRGGLGGASQGNNLRGMIKATQNNYLSQEQQIFTMLQSLTSSQNQSSQGQGELQQSQNKEEGQDNKYHKINDLFQNKRRRNQVMDNFKQSNMSKSSPAVQFIEDKIRFVKNYKVESSGFTKVFKKQQGKNRLRKGAILRAYKIGELPNIEISLQHILQPLIFLAAKDNELSSEIFLQFTSKICAFSLKNRNIVQEALCSLLMQSSQFNFNFISTLQKCMIKICQKHNKFLDLSLRQIAVQSNTLDYAVLFTQQNIIQLLLEKQSTDLESLKGKKDKILRQWFDLADYYQLLNEVDLIQSVMIRVTEGNHRQKLTKALKRKKDGDLGQAQGLINEILADNVSERLNKFLEKERIDCSVLLSQWDQICTDSVNKIERGQRQSSQEFKMLSIAIQNIQPSKRPKFLPLVDLQGQKYEYERGILSVMRENEMDKARYHSLNARELFRRQWDRVSSFAFNSKHQLLQSLQKNYQLIEFLQLYKQAEARDVDCKQLFQRWSIRKPDQIFDDNITWIQILSSRTLYGSFLGERWSLSAESMAKSNTEWLVQVVNGMVGKGVLGYAQNVIRKALKLHKLSKQFNWRFYQSISQLKLMQLVKKGSMRIQDYQIVPKLIKKEMDTFEDSSNYSKFKLITIRNQYLEGYLEVCLDKRTQMDLGQFAIQVINIYKSYEQVKKGLKNNMSDSIEGQFQKTIHFKYAVFLENLLSIVKGKFEIKQLREPLEKFNLNVKNISLKFMEELVYSIKLLDLGNNSALNYEDGQQLFSMILKLIKIVQIEHKTIGKNFEDAISDKNIPKWIFIYFIPQIIKNINNFDISIHFRELFDYLLANYPEALVYPFNCTYPRKKDCLTDLTKFLYDELHSKMGKYFQFIENLSLTQHPEMRLKDILTKHLYHGQQENAVLQLQEFNTPNPLLGKYNQRFHQNYKTKINNLLQFRRKKQNKQMNQLIKTMIAGLDPSKSNMMKYFTKLSDGSHWFQDYNCSDWTRLQVPGTSYNQFEEPHLWNKVYIESFDNSVLTLTSIRRPKRVTLLGSNEKVYMLLVKGGEDVRLDQRVEHLFELVNRIMDHNTQTNKKQLQISRFEVIPMKPMFGVFEWVDKSKTLRSFYQAELKQIKGKPEANLSTENEGFQEFHAYFKRLCPSSDDKHVWHKALMARPEEQVVKNMNRCEARTPYGLLRFGLEKLAKNYDSFLHLKNKFISNYSAICLITYIFGIGDRHLENFLIQTSTGNLVMIDFGYSFGASIELPIPELIPFRLTKSIKQLAAPIGIEGSFKKCMLACFEALNKKMHLIVDYCDVFVDDPLMEWVWVSRRQLNQSHQVVYIPSGNQSFSVSQEAPEKKLFSNKIKVVQNKLRGQNPRLILELLLMDSRHKSTPYIESLKKAIWGKAKSKSDILSGEELVNELIGLATDRNITGRSYIGLNLFV